MLIRPPFIPPDRWLYDDSYGPTPRVEIVEANDFRRAHFIDSSYPAIVSITMIAVSALMIASAFPGNETLIAGFSLFLCVGGLGWTLLSAADITSDPYVMDLLHI